MAGDWLKWTKGLTRKREVLAIADSLNTSRQHVAGSCMEVWEWADENTTDGRIGGSSCHGARVTPKQIGDAVGCGEVFLRAMESVGWLEIDELGVTIPKFLRHNGKSAKERALGAERQRARRVGKGGPVTEMSRSNRDKSVTREEKRREEKSIKNTHPTLPVGVREQQADQMETLLNLGPKNETPHDIPDNNPGIQHDRLTIAMMALLGQSHANFKHRHREQVDNLLVEKYEPDELAALMEECTAKKLKWAAFIKKAWEIGKKPSTHLTDDDFPVYEMSEETKAMFRAKGEKV